MDTVADTAIYDVINDKKFDKVPTPYTQDTLSRTLSDQPGCAIHSFDSRIPNMPTDLCHSPKFWTRAISASFEPNTDA
jgi:hypothetical protein